MRIILLTLALGSLSTLPVFAQNANEDEKKINDLLKTYITSINFADTVLGKKVFLLSPSISFIHPRGHEKGWEGIKNNIYGMFGATFSQRNLMSNSETITQYQDMAILEFYWVFDAAFKDGHPIQTKGRETQVLKKVGGEWKIVHIHYSSMPVTGERQGF